MMRRDVRLTAARAQVRRPQRDSRGYWRELVLPLFSVAVSAAIAVYTLRVNVETQRVNATLQATASAYTNTLKARQEVYVAVMSAVEELRDAATSGDEDLQAKRRNLRYAVIAAEPYLTPRLRRRMVGMFDKFDSFSVTVHKLAVGDAKLRAMRAEAEAGGIDTSSWEAIPDNSELVTAENDIARGIQELLHDTLFDDKYIGEFLRTGRAAK